MSESPYFNPEMETMKSDALRAWHNDQVRRIVSHAYQHAPGVRQIMERVAVTPRSIQGVNDLVKIPVTRKDDLIELQRANPPFGGFLGIPVEQVKRLYLSPGPLYDPEGPEPDYWRWAQALHAAGFRAGDIVQNTAAYHLTPLGFMLDDGLRKLGCVVIPSGPGNTESQAQIIRELGVTGYVGVPSYLMTIIEHIEKQGLDWQQATRLTKAFVVAEPFPPSLRQALAERGIAAREGYGTAETGNLGFACEAASGWHVPYDVLVQVVDINTSEPLDHGQEGEVVVTVFDPTYPLIRFGTGDLSALNLEPCSCGRTTPRLVGWLGRVGQAVKVKGMFVHPRQLAQALGGFSSVHRYQGVVTREGHRDELTVRIEPQQGQSLDEGAISQALQAALKLRVQVVVVKSGVIPDGEPLLTDARTWE